MKIIVAKHIGFCFGVRRAVGLAKKTLDENDKGIYSLGPIIHNPNVVKELSARGLKIVSKLGKLKEGSVLLIRSHGLLPSLIEKAGRRGITMVDATCPFVKKAQNICRSLSRDGYGVVVVGDKQHPEVKSLVGFGGRNVKVLERPGDLKNFKASGRKIGVVAQTTQSRSNYLQIASELVKRSFGKKTFSEDRVFDTICSDTARRQSEAKKISKRCDRIIVIGGRISANSRRLAQICGETGTKTIHIETAAEIRPGWFKGARCVGIVSGASTPDNIIEDVIKRLKKAKHKETSVKHR